MSAVQTRSVLKITGNTFLKRRVVSSAQLGPDEKIAKGPCRVYVKSYAYEYPGENLMGHVRVEFEGPFMGSTVWYVYGHHCCIEGQPNPYAPKPAAVTVTAGAPGKMNQAGLDLLKHFEGLRLDAYVCAAGVVTIGYGSTGSHVRMGDHITEVQAEQLLVQDLGRFEKGVTDMVKVPLNSNQFSALVSFAFNLGNGALQNSTLLKKLNQKDYNGAADEFLRWNKAGGRALEGLTRRRKAERELFLKP